MLEREVLGNGKVLLELLDASGEAILTLTLHQPVGERLLHAHLFEFLDERERLALRPHLRLAAGDDVIPGPPPRA